MCSPTRLHSSRAVGHGPLKIRIAAIVTSCATYAPALRLGDFFVLPHPAGRGKMKNRKAISRSSCVHSLRCTYSTVRVHTSLLGRDL